MIQRQLFSTAPKPIELPFAELLANCAKCFICETLLGEGDCKHCAGAREVDAIDWQMEIPE